MASNQTSVDFLVAQMETAGDIRSRKMFGEYALYCDDKVIAFVCDDQLFIKPTQEVRDFLNDVVEAPPYPGAKMYFLIDAGQWDDADFMARLARLTADALPRPKPKRRPQ